MAKYRIGDTAGPYDIDDVVTPAADLANSHLDLGSVLVPVVEGGQVTVEMSATHQPEAVYLETPIGRVGVLAFAAPRSGGQWRELVRELAESLQAEGAQTSFDDGHWGREVLAKVDGGEHRFIGVDGPRWMVRCVASGPDGTADQLAQLARAILAETVVRRGKEPFPPRDVLPIVLPPVLAEQVSAAQQQMAAETGVGPDGRPAVSSLDDAPTAPAADAEVLPGGAVAQAAAANVFTEGAPAAAVDDPETDVDDETPDDETPTPSEGSAMQRLRGRRKRRRR
ncbi:MAG: DUF3710 domain-containing protein [Gordonia sp. (in: high G+C Gram-positive bacteria)]|uniref:DUF3710 domain-containing protein n=1 Tax=Gordonia sp. (in: high G+C Gram-positive bacteria) TaxID=84139 RepID=UPI0039E50A5D